jgi:sortase A
MFLRVGLIAVAVSVLFAGGVALVLSLNADDPTPASASAEPVSAPATEPTTKDNKFNLGEKLQLDHEPSQQPPQEEPKSQPEPAPPPANNPAPPPPEEKPAPSQGSLQSLPVSGANWPYPTKTELGQLGQPRYFAPDSGAVMTLTIEALGLYDVPIFDSWSEDVLSQGIMHIPDTAYPWDSSKQKNVFLAGHRVGLPGTNGRLLFFNIDSLSSGDTVTLKDRSGNEYRYRVTNIFQVRPEDAWVADTLVGRDLLTLQTCTYPTFENRLVVRADRA